MLSRTIFQINPTPKLVHPGGLPMVMIAVDHGVLVVVAVGIYIADGTKARIADHTMSGGSVFRTASFIAAMIMGTMWNATVHTLTVVGGAESCTIGPLPCQEGRALKHKQFFGISCRMLSPKRATAAS